MPVLYKYRSLADLEFILDIILSRRLYAAHYFALNDPMEGKFSYRMPWGTSSKEKEFLRSLINRQKQLRICSLSKSSNNTLLWSYYADAHKGIAFGVRISSAQREVHDVRYTNDLEFKPFEGSEAGREAIKILLNKTPQWKHEQEVRILTESQYVNIKLEEVIFGCNVSQFHESIVRKLLRAAAPHVEVRKIKPAELDQRASPNLEESNNVEHLDNLERRYLEAQRTELETEIAHWEAVQNRKLVKEWFQRLASKRLLPIARAKLEDVAAKLDEDSVKRTVHN